MKDWKTTRLDGDVLDYLGKLVTDGKLDPVWFSSYNVFVREESNDCEPLFTSGRGEDLPPGPGGACLQIPGRGGAQGETCGQDGTGAGAGEKNTPRLRHGRSSLQGIIRTNGSQCEIPIKIL